MLFVSYLCLLTAKLYEYHLWTIYTYYNIVYKYYINIPVYKLYMAHVPLLLLLELYTNNITSDTRLFMLHVFSYTYMSNAHTYVFHKPRIPLHVRARFTDWTQILCANAYALFFIYIIILTCYIYFAYTCPINVFTCSIHTLAYIIHTETCIMTADYTRYIHLHIWMYCIRLTYMPTAPF